ncbi:toll/interleukin-1 receptor domain-containing protein [Micromonospora sp. I033]
MNVEAILDFVIHGENLPGDMIDTDSMGSALTRLEQQLQQRGYDWKRVSLLVLANSKMVGGRKDQIDSDSGVRDGLMDFCAARGWHPSLIGASVHSSFFQSRAAAEDDIHDGILLIAVISAVFPKLPVSCNISQKGPGRKNTARQVVEECVTQYRRQLQATYGIDWTSEQIFESSTGLLFTSGSGHVERSGHTAREFIDFSDCYALGQELLEVSEEARVIGGCASNRTSNLFQTIYYSVEVGGTTSYRFSYNHCAVVALLPYMTPRFLLLHPFDYAQDATPLRIEWDRKDEYADGRYYYIRTINGEPPVEFLSRYWDLTREELDAMEEKKTPIPTEPKSYRYTIGSSKHRNDRSIWPNVPVWFERVGDQVMLRVVRAEAHDSNYFLMVMGNEPSRAGIDAIQRNCADLANYFQSTTNRTATVLSFDCESRKYLLNSQGSNLEAKSMAQMLPDLAQVVGIYVNGEYSVGSKKSIGYHNFSQISAIVAERPTSELPSVIKDRMRPSSSIKLFVSHASRDKELVKKIVLNMGEGIPKIEKWMDEYEIPTGAHLEREISRAINDAETSFVLAFVSSSALRSNWVRDELDWAIAEQQRRRRTYVLPVLLDDVRDELASAWPERHVEYLMAHKYLVLREYSDDAVEAFSRKLAQDLKLLLTP